MLSNGSNIVASTIKNGTGNGKSGGPSSLEIEASGDAIDIEHLACEIDVRMGFAFEGIRIDGREIDTTAGDKLILEGGSTCNLIAIVAEGINQAVKLFLAEILPTVLGALAKGLIEQISPKARR